MIKIQKEFMKLLLLYETINLIRRLGLFLLLGIVMISCNYSYDFPDFLEVKLFPERKGDFSIWQLDQFFNEVQMGYIIRTDDNKIAVVDGGGMKTAPILENYLKQLGGIVDIWIITHPHLDHMGAFLEIVDKGSIDIKTILQRPLEDKWVLQHEPDSYESVVRYNNTLKKSNILQNNATKGVSLKLGNGVEIKVFGSRNDSITANAINNSSLVCTISSKFKSVLFLGDLGPEGGDKILEQSNLANLKVDYVQMAHHGQRGVSKAFYETVQADYALWPTPEWLWENRVLGKGVDSGDYKTIQVRQWMTELLVKKNYVAGIEKTIQID
jgi:metallo-beta-lactamase superfamily protein